jgi:hypothetical protein
MVMLSETEKRKGGGKLARSETVTVRLDPKLRYLAELAARRQRRTVSSYIEWAIEDSLKHFSLDLNGNGALADEAEALWDVDEADRFARLALRHPDLLTHEEQVLWKLLKENGLLWRGKYAGFDQQWTWTVREESLMYDRLRKHWAKFCSVAEGSAPASELPTWIKNQPKDTGSPPPKASTGFDDMDDDIPF